MEYIHEETIMFVAIIGLVGWVLWLLFRRHQVAVQARMQKTESFNRLLEKFGNTKEFIDFIQTDQGKKFIAEPLLVSVNPMKNVLRFIIAGVFFLAMSVAFMLNWFHLTDWLHSQTAPDMNEVRKAMDYYYWFTINVTMSAGMFIISGVSYLLARKWHMTNGNSK